MAFRRDAIRQIGGFKVTAEYCADDFVLGNETFKLGKTVILSHHAIDHIVLNSRFADSMKHQVRWMKSTRFSRPAGHFGTALSFSMDRQPSAPGASAISEGSGNLGALAFPSIKPSSSRLFAQVRTADAGIAGQPDQWHMQPFRPARSWVTPQSAAHDRIPRRPR